MKYLLLTILFTLPMLTSAASFEFVAGDIAKGETGEVTLYVLPEGESVYSAQAVIAFDGKSLAVDNIAVSSTLVELSKTGYDTQVNGQIIKTAGFPGGITEKTALLTFSVTKLTDGVGVIAVESASAIYNGAGVNVATSFDTKIFGTFTPAATLPAGFTLSEDVSTPEPIVEEEVAAPIEEVTEKITLPAAVISVEGALPVVPFLILLVVLLIVLAIYFMIRSGRRRV